MVAVLCYLLFLGMDAGCEKVRVSKGKRKRGEYNLPNICIRAAKEAITDLGHGGL